MEMGMNKLIVAMLIAASVPTIALAQSAPPPPTLIQQLQSFLAYELDEEDEYPQPNYHTYRAQRLQGQLATANAAAASGNPLPPQLNEHGVITPLYPPSGK
jgi:hypothetical protein